MEILPGLMWLGHHVGSAMLHDMVINHGIGTVVADHDVAGGVPSERIAPVVANDFASLDQACDVIVGLYKKNVNVGLVLSDRRHPVLLIAWLIARVTGATDVMDVEEALFLNYGLDLEDDQRTSLADALAVRTKHASFHGMPPPRHAAAVVGPR